MRRLLLCALLVFSCAAFAGRGTDEVRKQVESALYVTGTIDITPSGKVVEYALDQPEKLPKGIIDMTARLLPQWTFEPIALQDAAVSRSKMNLLFVGRKLDDGRYSVELRSATFSGTQADEAVAISPKNRKLPNYPLSLIDAGVSGTVYLIVKVGRDGKVMAVDASHVNLRVISRESNMQQWRNILARTSIAAAKQWTFLPPTSGTDADKPYWFGTLPIDYTLASQKISGYGEWQTYVAGPKTLIPWLDDTLMAEGNTDALTPNSFHTAGSGRRLLTPLAGS